MICHPYMADPTGRCPVLTSWTTLWPCKVRHLRMILVSPEALKGPKMLTQGEALGDTVLQ